MLVGRISMDGKKHPFYVMCDEIREYVGAIKDMYYIKHHYVITCKKCKIQSAPFLNPICGPYNDGMIKVKHGFVCHWCKDGYIDISYYKERRKFAKQSNEELKFKLHLYKQRYPWVKIRHI